MPATRTCAVPRRFDRIELPKPFPFSVFAVPLLAKLPRHETRLRLSTLVTRHGGSNQRADFETTSDAW